VAERHGKVAERLQQINAGTAAGDVAQVGSELVYLTALSNVQLQIHDQMSKAAECFTRWPASPTRVSLSHDVSHDAHDL
jgi:hypothetical protein